MSDLIEKDPRLARIIDPKTSRNLLEEAHPLEVTMAAGKTTTIPLRLENGLEAPIDLTITSDQDWLEPKTKQISLLGGEKRECQLLLHRSSLPEWMTPTIEFANLCFTWKGETETYQEFILVWRKG